MIRASIVVSPFSSGLPPGPTVHKNRHLQNLMLMVPKTIKYIQCQLKYIITKLIEAPLHMARTCYIVSFAFDQPRRQVIILVCLAKTLP